MIRKWKLLLVGVSCVMGTAMAQNNPILLFPKGAPGETTKLIEKARGARVPDPRRCLLRHAD